MHPSATLDQPHTWLEDTQALLIGTLVTALGLILLRQAGLLSSGIAGLAFLVHYSSGWSLGAVFFTLNLPFFILSWHKLGPASTVKSLIAVGLLSVFTEALPRWMGISHLSALYAAVMGGLLVGAGVLFLMRHRTSLGGLTVLAMWLQEAHGWRAGRVLLGFDLCILAAALALREPQQVALSLIGASALSWVVAVNHKPGRYTGRSEG